jgi:hypothetical protein
MKISYQITRSKNPDTINDEIVELSIWDLICILVGRELRFLPFKGSAVETILRREARHETKLKQSGATKGLKGPSHDRFYAC